MDHGYVHTQDRFDFIDGIFEVARAAKSFGFKLVVITNQARIVGGFYSEEQFQKLTDWMCKEFINANAPLEKVYYSPLHPKAGLGVIRKMITQKNLILE